MGMGFRLSLQWDFPFRHHSTPSRLSSCPSPSSSTSCSGRGRETSFEPTRLSFLSNIVEEGDTLHKDALRAYTCSSASLPTLEYDTTVSIGKRSCSSLSNSDGDSNIYSGGNKSASAKGLQPVSASHFSLLMENLNALEATISAADILNLERDILLQLGRLGALKLFQTCLSKALSASMPEPFDLSFAMIEQKEEQKGREEIEKIAETIIRSGKGGLRKSKREGDSKKANQMLKSSLLPSTDVQPVNSSARQTSNSKRRKSTIAKNEAEMSKGVKVIAHLERIRTILEEETGQVVSLACWAEAAGVDEKDLQRSLHFGWFCRDEILRSTRSLVLFLARNYRGLGIALEDLVQAGNMGVIIGAERFDHTRGCRFSTYVQYWIRKSMSRMVSRHARGIRVPYTLSSAINQIQKARKSLNYHNGKYPDDEEIAKFSGLSVAKIKSASKCLRVVGSINQKVGDCISAKYMELAPDLAIKSPEKTVMRQHLRSEIYELLNGLDVREKQVLMLRYGLRDHRPRSLEEIGRIFRVSKEWIRKIEKKALKKLRDLETCQSLSHYLNL
ncbi:RNA polymerase sigma factor sigC-like isoform X2 [Punica granatum]|uniref:RNA polymerase sigma factor sigC-like isoform X2 n=2 Tax=Punica granatum TaxID=22663 RepID=A0A6P8CK20_PUNGR|nr:RNA polymerase sigma factor sigC-like isoform X2 [Punica granatum]